MILKLCTEIKFLASSKFLSYTRKSDDAKAQNWGSTEGRLDGHAELQPRLFPIQLLRLYWQWWCRPHSNSKILKNHKELINCTVTLFNLAIVHCDLTAHNPLPRIIGSEIAWVVKCEIVAKE